MNVEAANTDPWKAEEYVEVLQDAMGGNTTRPALDWNQWIFHALTHGRE